MHPGGRDLAYRRGIITQTYTYTTNGRTHSAAFFLVWIVLGVALALIPGFIASRKGRSFALFFLFGLFCWLPALIVALVISDDTVGPYGAGGAYGTWNPQPGGWVPPTSQPSWSTPPPPPTTPAGWYPDPGGSAQQRYWDGTQWTEHLH